MPSIAAHMICAKLVGSKLGINDSEFIKGNLLPDIIAMENSHKKIKGKHYYIPNIEYFVNTLNLSDNLYLGYLSHLLLDKFFLEDYIYYVVNGEEVFLNRTMYNEYDIINYELLNVFNIDVGYLNSILKNFNVPIDEKKYSSNIKSLNNKIPCDNLKYLNVDDFSDFLIRASDMIAEYIKKVKKQWPQI